MMGAAAKDPRLTERLHAVPHQLAASCRSNIDRNKAKSIGVSLSDIFQTMEVDLGSLYVNNFTYLNRSWQVDVQADAPYRNSVASLQKLYVTPARRRRTSDRAESVRDAATGRGDDADHATGA